VSWHVRLTDGLGVTGIGGAVAMCNLVASSGRKVTKA